MEKLPLHRKILSIKVKIDLEEHVFYAGDALDSRPRGHRDCRDSLKFFFNHSKWLSPEVNRKGPHCPLINPPNRIPRPLQGFQDLWWWPDASGCADAQSWQLHHASAVVEYLQKYALDQKSLPLQASLNDWIVTNYEYQLTISKCCWRYRGWELRLRRGSLIHVLDLRYLTKAEFMLLWNVTPAGEWIHPPQRIECLQCSLPYRHSETI